jgi:hypothetical protein
MPTYVMRDGNLVEKNRDSWTDAPQVISDTMEPTRHMADGRMYTSKRKFRQATKDAGCVELGNEAPIMKRPVPLDRQKRREDIKRAKWMLENGMAPTIKQILSGEER